jgi:hypothetical protein
LLVSVFLLSAASRLASGAVVYTYTQDITTGASVTFSRTLPNYLGVGDTIQFGLSDISASGGGAVSTIVDPLVMTRTAGGLTIDSWTLNFNPPIVYGPQNLALVSVTVTEFLPGGFSFPCALNSPCDINQAGGSGVLASWTNSPTGGGNAFGAVLRITVSEAPDVPPPSGEVPEPHSVALVGAGMGGLVLLRRRRGCAATRRLLSGWQ